MPQDQMPRSFEQGLEAYGLDLTSSVDVGKPPRYPVLQNVRQIRRGTLVCRPALNALVSAPAAKTPWHSVRRLNDKPTNQYALIAGIGTELMATAPAAASANPGAVASKDSGYSGNPLSLVPFKPVNDVAEWMAVSDQNKMRKIRLDGTVHQLGLPQPTTPPDTGLDYVIGFQRLDIEEGTGFASWGVSAPGGIAAIDLVRTNAQCTVVRTLWGDGFDPTGGLSSGWLSIEVGAGPPSGLVGLGPGTVLRDNGGNKILVEQLLPQTPATTTINQIVYVPDGSNTRAVFVPKAAYNEFRQHSIVHFVHGITDMYGVITAVIKGPDNTIAVEVYGQSIGGLVANDTVETRPTVFGYAPAAYPGAAAMTAHAVKYVGLNNTSTVYTMSRTGLALNLSAFGATGKQVDTTLDEMHVSLYSDDWSMFDNIQFQLDCDDGTFTKNYFTHIVRQADLLALQTGALSAIDTRDQQNRNQQINSPQNLTNYITNPLYRGGGLLQSTPGQIVAPPRDPGTIYPAPGSGTGGPSTDPSGGAASQGATGLAQWTEVRFKLSDLVRYGSDTTKGLQLINAIRVSATRTAITTAGVNISFGGWWIGGGSPPDVFLGAPYEYRYRYRCSSTGARSNWSPAGRSFQNPHRCSVFVSPKATGSVGSPTPPAEADKIDIQRRGGSVQQWITIGTIDSSGTMYFTDTYDDSYAIGAASDPLALEGNINDQPFTVQQPAFTATATVVAGTLIQTSGSFTNMLSGSTAILQQGCGVVVNGIATLVRRLMTANIIEVYDNVGAGTNVKLEIPSPFFVNQPLPVIFGHANGWYFGLGDTKNPGRLYVFKGGTMDAAPGSYVADITDPSDPLQNGCVFYGRAYVWSSEAMYALTIDPSAPGAPVRWERLTGAIGMFARYALTVGDMMYWLGKDGIYASDGGSSHNITVGTLARIFPSKGIDGSSFIDPFDGATVLIPAPSMTQANAVADGTALHQFRLSYTYDNVLWFDYVDIGGARRTLSMQRGAGIGMMMLTGVQAQYGWWYDTYANGALFHYSAEGENIRQILVGGTSATSKLYQMSASTNGDDGTPIACRFRTFQFDADAPRPKKDWSDLYLDADASTASLAVNVYYDNMLSKLTPAASPLTGAGRSKRLLDLNSGRGLYALNVGVDVQWTTAAAEAVVVHGWGGSVLARPDDTIQRSDEFTDCGFWGPKEFRGADIECSSSSYDINGSAVATSKTLTFEYTKDDGTVGAFATTISAAEKSIVPVAFPAAVIGYEIRIRPTDANTWKEFEVKKWHFDPLADLTALITPWEGEQQEYVQGLELFADSNGFPIALTIQKDFGVTATPPFNVTHSGRGWKSYSFPSPFLAYLRRIVPSGPIRLMRWRWVAKPEAPLGDVWEAQEIELGDPFGFSQSAEIEYASSTPVTLKWYVDGTLVTTDTTTLAATGGTDPSPTSFSKKRVILNAGKGRLGKLRLESSAQFRVREKGTGVYRKSYGVDGGLTFAPLSGASHGSGAEV